MDRLRITQPKQLLVERKSDMLFFHRLLAALDIPDIEVKYFGSKNNLRTYLSTFLALSDFQSVVSLGIVRDADDSAQAAFQSVCSTLNHFDLPMPQQPELLSVTLPRVGVYIMPGNRRSGNIERLCVESVTDDAAMPCVDAYLNCLNNANALHTNEWKSRCFAFIASRKEPEAKLGEAAKFGYWPWDSQAYDRIKTFLQAL